jgi:predicted DNA-binding ribbon-helix-helix protein
MIVDPEGAHFQKRSVSLYGHKTSVSLEKAFWDVLEEATIAQSLSLSQLIREVDERRIATGLSRALRLYALSFLLSKRQKG